MKRRLGIAFRIACLAATAIALWWFLRGIDVQALGDTFERAMLWPLTLAVLLNISGHLVRAEGWLIMLGPRHQLPFGRLLRYEFAAQAASAITPARAGEVLRLWLLKRDAVPVTTTGALIVLKKMLGGVGLAILVIGVPWLLPGVPDWVSSVIAVFVAIMVIQLVTVIVVARRVKPDKLPKILSGLVGGMYFLRDSRRMRAVLAVMLVGEATDAAAAAAVLYAVHINLPIAAAILILFLIDISNMLPVAPGHVGTFEVGAFFALDLLHVQLDAAFAFALLFHAQQVLPQIVIGLPLELRFLVGRRRGGDGADPSTGCDHDGAGHSQSGG